MNNQKMDEDVRWAVRGDVHEAVDDDSNHPGLQDFLLEVGAEG